MVCSHGGGDRRCKIGENGIQQAAHDRFGSVGESYSQQRHGTSRNVGVIGIAVFEETNQDADKRTEADPFPSNWATPPRR